MGQSQDEKQLLNRIVRGDAQAFEQLFDRYWRYLHNVAYNRLQSAGVADDLVQDVFTDIWKSRESLEVHVSLKTYLYQAVRYKVLNFIRHQEVRTREEYVKRIEAEYYESNDGTGTEEIVDYNELQCLIEDQINTMPGKTQEIFRLSRRQHCTHKEIAQKLNCSSKTVEYHIGKALHNLRLSLKEYVWLIPLFLMLLF